MLLLMPRWLKAALPAFPRERLRKTRRDKKACYARDMVDSREVRLLSGCSALDRHEAIGGAAPRAMLRVILPSYELREVTGIEEGEPANSWKGRLKIRLRC